MAFFIPRSVSKECLGQGKNAAKASPSLTRFEVAIMSVLRPESLGFHNPMRQQGMAFFIPRSVSKECLGQGKKRCKS